MFWFIVVAVVVVGVLLGLSAEKSKRQAKEAYETALGELKHDPNNSDLRQLTLALGRTYSNLMRDKKGHTVFDEVALMNDINAACAGAALSAAPIPAQLTNAIASIEGRLRQLQSLKAEGLIAEEDYLLRKREIMSQI